KEGLRNDLHAMEQEMSELRNEVADQRRIVEDERNHMKLEIEHAKRVTREDTLRHLPEEFEKQRAADKKRFEQQHMATDQQLKGQLEDALESHKNLAAKLKMYLQERERFQADMQDAQTTRDDQNKLFMQRIAEMQLRETALQDDLQTKDKEAAALREALE